MLSYLFWSSVIPMSLVMQNHWPMKCQGRLRWIITRYIHWSFRSKLVQPLVHIGLLTIRCDNPSTAVIYKMIEESQKHRDSLFHPGLPPVLYCIRQQQHLCVDAVVVLWFIALGQRILIYSQHYPVPALMVHPLSLPHFKPQFIWM